jgi:hypothetical protein
MNSESIDFALAVYPPVQVGPTWNSHWIRTIRLKDFNWYHDRDSGSESDHDGSRFNWSILIEANTAAGCQMKCQWLLLVLAWVHPSVTVQTGLSDSENFKLSTDHDHDVPWHHRALNLKTDSDWGTQETLRLQGNRRRWLGRWRSEARYSCIGPVSMTAQSAACHFVICNSPSRRRLMKLQVGGHWAVSVFKL